MQRVAARVLAFCDLGATTHLLMPAPSTAREGRSGSKEQKAIIERLCACPACAATHMYSPAAPRSSAMPRRCECIRVLPVGVLYFLVRVEENPFY